MKIRSIEAFKIPALSIRTGWAGEGAKGEARRAPWQTGAEVANPMSRYPRYKALRESWRGKFDAVGVVVTADDGSWGFGTTILGPATTSLINDHLGPLLVDENPMATDKLWDMMMRIASPYSPAGLASYAISGIDLALWDLKGRVLKAPVYELAGGPVREAQFCYATGNDTDWHMELGFKATKLACPYGTADGLDALRRNEELVASTRELIGPEVELMLDCWMAFDVEFAVRLAEQLRPYRLKWIEDCLIPEDMASHKALRARLPWMTLTRGEHWYTPYAFFAGAKRPGLRHLPAGRPLGRRLHRLPPDRRHRRGGGARGDPARRDEHALRPAPDLLAPEHAVGRMVPRRGAGRAAEADDRVPGHGGARERLLHGERRPRLRPWLQPRRDPGSRSDPEPGIRPRKGQRHARGGPLPGLGGALLRGQKHGTHEETSTKEEPRMTHERPILWRIMASAMIAVPFLASSGSAQDIGQVPRENTLVMTPWGDRPGPFANIENFNPYLISVDHERNIGHMTYNEALFYTNMNTGRTGPLAGRELRAQRRLHPGDHPPARRGEMGGRRAVHGRGRQVHARGSSRRAARGQRLGRATRNGSRASRRPTR